MSERVHVAGVGMIPFAKPGRSDDYDVMGERAMSAALADADIGYELIQQAYAGYVYGDSTCGQRTIYRVGMTGIPVVNVNNNCASGSSALWLARQAVASGAVECALAVGFEQMQPGALGRNWTDRPPALGRFEEVLDDACGIDPDAPRTPQFFGQAGAAYLSKYDAKPETFAKVSVKSRRHAANNPYAVFRDPISEDEVLASPMIFDPLTRLQCCPPTCGAAAAIICSESFARKHGLRRDVSIKGQVLATDLPETFSDNDPMNLVGYGVSTVAARQLYEESGVDPTELDVVELHDCFTVNEVLTYEALGLTPEGTAEKFILEGDNTYGGQVVVNPSGGLLSKGHPLGATGLAQCAELTWQLRGHAEARQAEGVKLALQHNLGLGSAGVLTLFEKVS